MKADQKKNLSTTTSTSSTTTTVYPSALRGTFYGISAAIGKTGAAIGTQVSSFRYVETRRKRRRN